MGAKRQTQAGKIGISKLLRRDGLKLIAFGFVAGRTKCQDVSFPTAVDDFKSHFGLNEADIPTDSLLREIHRMTLEYLTEGV